MRLVRQRYGDPGDARVEWPDDTHHERVVDERLDVLGPQLRVVDALRRVVAGVNHYVHTVEHGVLAHEEAHSVQSRVACQPLGA